MVSTRTGSERVSAVPSTTGTPCGAAAEAAGLVSDELGVDELEAGALGALLEAVCGASDAARLLISQ
ncbi:hypothetical protein FRZ61_27510 [Hypericibacter adhaerens]|jgi:hypothetical protein|uniref:Uncharacterized protein n=1 Tax=Hypericibacter adhaerens TaxID=2602016 RepID=A0A5J6MYL3_9PROT|nr:hypothetical protein FRZ61_27510 [Hypericibacter adhaerens]